jgi:hypothetical protein
MLLSLALLLRDYKHRDSRPGRKGKIIFPEASGRGGRVKLFFLRLPAGAEG